jgi:hypothetical protein
MAKAAPMTQTQKIERLMKLASEFVGFEINSDTYRNIQPEKATALLAQLARDPDYQELALLRGSPIAEANIWLSGRMSGTDLPLEDVARMSQGLSQKPEVSSDASDFAAGSNPPAAANDARARLDALSRDPDWRAKALTRGTPQARENLELNAAISGVTYSGEALDRMTNGLSQTPG